jgi:hypothetical protein
VSRQVIWEAEAIAQVESRTRARWRKAAGESQTSLTAEPLDLDHQHEIIRRINQERDQAPAVRAEMQ